MFQRIRSPAACSLYVFSSDIQWSLWLPLKTVLAGPSSKTAATY